MNAVLLVCVSSLLATTCLSAVDARFVVAERGMPADCTIVVRDAATACERYAADELRDFLRCQTGVELPIVIESADVKGKVIAISIDESNATLGGEGFTLRVEGDRLSIFGGRARGALFGVYELLERFGGCAWYSSWHEVIPRLDRFEVPRTLNEAQTPAFEIRFTSWCDMTRFHPELAIRNKIWKSEYNSEKFGDSPWRFDPELGICHTFRKLVPVEKWFDSHPEYFSEIGGRRRKTHTQLCLTNPDVVRIAIEAVRERIRESYPKGYRIYGVSQDDWAGWCECPKCRSVNEAEGSKSGTLVDFVNAIAADVAKDWPDVFIETLVYAYTRQPPKTRRFRPNVLPCFCTSECDFSKAIPDSRAEENIAVRDMLRVWGEKSDRLLVWDYTTAFKNYLYVWPNVRALARNIRYYKECGVTALTLQGDRQGLFADWGELKGWLVAKLMWNPDQDIDALLDRYFRDNFGPGASDIREWFNTIHNFPRDERVCPMSCFVEISETNLPKALLDHGAALFESAARKAAAPGLEAYSRNVATTRLSLDFTRAIKFGVRIPLKKCAEPMDDGYFRELREGARRVLARTDGRPGIRFAEHQGRHDSLRRLLEALSSREHPVVVRNGRLSYGTRDIAIRANRPDMYAYVKDPDAKDGIAAWFSPTHYNWSASFMTDDNIDYDPNAVYRLRVHVKVAKDSSISSGEAFWTGIYNPVLKTYPLEGIAPRVEDVPDGRYEWYTVGEWKPTVGEYIWFGPGRFTGERSCHRGVWLDAFEIELVR